ncbi:tetratricopeptide repeat protein [Gilvimarinus sp. SDUM040013]|uniref:Tetratricopeptide repeat protein n=1 Tax=Gilvimarinus gilvus TaxID=3058038 RepID=A0ABU4S127_9GAMM|nr:tetratricopeptide repeat protein [Gilvimarinus sp. SDUM040013]MDO3384620.1 tetratricopeptide repeat protein [Gilvimarinus sp. SDUM040013]MDX6850206.1 tetratricopeptide repeat protein [Gilvimarinus sp. SDUM040013]
MNCINSLHSLALATIVTCLFAGCATTPEPEPASETQQADATSTFIAALPPGPVTLNPYLDTPGPKVSRALRNDFATALGYMDDQNWSQARQALQAIVANAPELSAAWLNLGVVWVKLNEPGQAKAAFGRSLAANPLNVDAYNHLAALERREGRFDEAEKLYQDALAVWPHSVDSHKNLGILYDLYLGNWPQALLHYQAAQHIIEQTQGEPDRELAGWIIDLQRRIAAGGQP